MKCGNCMFYFILFFFIFVCVQNHFEFGDPSEQCETSIRMVQNYLLDGPFWYRLKETASIIVALFSNLIKISRMFVFFLGESMFQSMLQICFNSFITHSLERLLSILSFTKHIQKYLTIILGIIW